MPLETAVVGFCVTLLSILLFLVWRIYLPKSWVDVDSSGRQISWKLIFLWMAPTVIIFEPRKDSATLLTEGLSTQNILQLTGSVVATLWAFWLLASRRVRLGSLLTGPNFLMFILIIVYALSTFWSIWPALTLYRTVELTALWVLTIHVFASSKNLETDIHHFFMWSIALCLFGGLVHISTPLQGHVFAGLRANISGTVAAVYGLYSVYLLQRSINIKNVSVLLFAVLCMILFGSMAAWLSFSAALPLLFLYRLTGPVKVIVLQITILIIVGIVVYILYTLENPSSLEMLSAVFDKQEQGVLSLTGRLPLWTTIWEETQDAPWGFGFAAADRLFVIKITTIKHIGWQASHAHNGYISGWIGAGWMGIIGVILILLALWLHSGWVIPQYRPLLKSMIVFLSINNLTVPGVGGSMTLIWFIAMIISSFPIAASKRNSSVFSLGIPTSCGVKYSQRYDMIFSNESYQDSFDP